MPWALTTIEEWVSFTERVEIPINVTTSRLPVTLLSTAATLTLLAGWGGAPAKSAAAEDYPWHHDIVSTTFWVGEVFDPNADDGSQVISTYDSRWMENYGGCDGAVVDSACLTERRIPDNGYFPLQMTPRQNPFYLDLPFDDINDETAFQSRGDVVPWAGDPGFNGQEDNRSFSYMKNRWVRLRNDDRVCYGQIQDAGPGQYHDADYVFGTQDSRPANTEFNGAGLDVSPALNGCLDFTELDGDNDRIDWQFVDDADVPAGPWRNIVTTSGVG